MRLWSLHPRYLDSKGLVALWREALLAQKVLQGDTKGYRNHPQLSRFKEQKNPVAAMASYLHEVQREAEKRGYKFDAGKISRHKPVHNILVTDGQMAYEFRHLENKLKARDEAACKRLQNETTLQAHPVFSVVKGGVASWEIVPADD